MTDQGQEEYRAIYERMDGEPDLWYDRFERYRLMGPSRSLLAVYNAERLDRSEGPAKAIPGAWVYACRVWDWKNRASTWDAYEGQRRRELYDKEREEDHEARVMLLKAMRAKLVQRLNTLVPEEIKPELLVRGIQIVAQELRAEYDDLPVQRLDLDAMTDDELRAIVAGTRAR